MTRTVVEGAVETRTHIGSDGRERQYLVAVPARPLTAVAIAFHPWGFTPEAVLHGEEAGERLIRPLPGLLGPAAALGVALVAPRSAGRVLESISLGWGPHVDASHDVAAELAGTLGGLPLATVGLSQGGLESLVCAGRHPETITAAVAVNPLIDVAALYRDVDEIPVPHMKDRGALDEMRAEIGGTPDDCPREYEARSALNYMPALARVRVGLIWSSDDGVVARADEHHSGRLARELRAAGGVLDERRTTAVGDDAELAWRFAHESFDAWTALGMVVDMVRDPGTSNRTKGVST
jgi:pimeloyl-ACP methyl ester carboxylesterase